MMHVEHNSHKNMMEQKFKKPFFSIPLWMHRENGVPPNRKLMKYIMQLQNGTITSRELKSSYTMTKPLARLLNGKTTTNKLNRWWLELATYNITFEWISGAQNKAADCLSRLVELPQGRQATVQMLTVTNHDEPTFHTRSRTTQQNISEDFTTQPKTDTITPDITKVTDTPYAMPKSLTR